MAVASLYQLYVTSLESLVKTESCPHTPLIQALTEHPPHSLHSSAIHRSLASYKMRLAPRPLRIDRCRVRIRTNVCCWPCLCCRLSYSLLHSCALCLISLSLFALTTSSLIY